MRYIFFMVIAYFIFFIQGVLSIKYISPTVLLVFAIYTAATFWCIFEIKRALKDDNGL